MVRKGGELCRVIYLLFINGLRGFALFLQGFSYAMGIKGKETG